MAISTQYIYERVADLIQKKQAGYMPANSINRDMQAANLMLYEYYFQQYELTKKIANAMTPFLVETTINRTSSNNYSSLFDYPTDLFHETELKFEKVVNNNCSPPEVDLLPIDYLQDNEEAYTLSSAIRKPNVENNIIRWNRKNGVIHVYPADVKKITIKYLQRPTTPVYAVTFVSTPDQDFEQYDAVNSVDFAWGIQEAENIVDLMLLFQGMELRESAIINFAKAKQKALLIN